MQVGAEVSGATVSPITGHRAGADLYHVRCPSLETFDAGRTPLGSHGMSNGLALILPRQETFND